MKILFFKNNNRLFIELFIIYLLKLGLTNNILLINNYRFFFRAKNKIFFITGYVVLVNFKATVFHIPNEIKSIFFFKDL